MPMCYRRCETLLATGIVHPVQLGYKCKHSPVATASVALVALVRVSRSITPAAASAAVAIVITSAACKAATATAKSTAARRCSWYT